jgi:Pyruvate/2-oxoacid:ferredoxin oxidoreductase delta subunit
MDSSTTARRVIEIRKNIIGPPEPKRLKLRVRKIEDYPHVPRAILDLAEKLGSWMLLGPPLCDELVEFVRHVFNEEEASVARHLRPIWGRSAATVAKDAHRPVGEIEPILLRLADEKRVIASTGPEEKKKYLLIPIIGGIFEMALISQSPETMSEWHRRLAELVEPLFETGYPTAYKHSFPPLVRYLPVHQVLDVHPMALPSDKMEVILDSYETFGVGNCQCRMTMRIHGQDCGKPIFNCTVMGLWAEQGIEKGWLKQVSKKDVLEIKREAETHGMVNWLMNVAAAKGQSSCSCCGCCCHAMRVVSEYNAPGMIAPPHFLPKFDSGKCTSCGKCAKACPMAAIAVDTKAKTLEHLTARCIGCGLCVVACDSRKAVTLEPVPAYQLPYRSWFSLLFHGIPGMVKESWKSWKGNRWQEKDEV